jgi:oxygen-dependent protoporphyrinogen oxidase
MCECLVPPRRDHRDETLASFVRRRFGSEVLNRLVQPLVGGIYTSDPEQLSLAATLPRFLEMEATHGSLIRAARLTKSDDSDDDRTSSGARYGLFAGLRGGMRELVDALIARVRETCAIEIGAQILSVLPAADASPRAVYRLRLRDGRETATDAVLITLPAYRAADLVVECDQALASQLRSIEYASSAIVVSGHALAHIADSLQAFGLVVPHIERRRILAVSFSSRKFPNRAPEGRALLRTFVGGALQPEYLDLDDAALCRLVREELRDCLGVAGEPDFMEVYRYPRSMPQYHLGHLDRVAEIERLTEQHPGLALAGNAYRGVGVPDAIASGERAAERIVTSIAVL